VRKGLDPGGYFNPNALSLLLGVVQKITDRMRSFMDQDDEEAIKALRKEILHGFNDHPGVKATIKQIDAYLANGTLPNLVRK